jgi:hypothetical protein
MRLTDEETAAFRLRGEVEGRSMLEVVRAAVREYIDRHSRDDLIDRVMDSELPLR